MSSDLLDFGFVKIRWYSLFFALGFALSYLILKRTFAGAGVRIHLLDRLTIYVAVGTLIGARLGHCLFYDFAYYRQHLIEIFLPVQFSPSFKFTGYQGLASHGGALGIFAALLVFSKKYNVSFLWLADRLALVVPLAGCCIRLGNLMNSEIIGKPARLPWAFVFTKVDLLPRHPAQLYEAVAYLLILLIIHSLKNKSLHIPGLLFGWLLTLIFLARFFIEFFKENQEAFESGWSLNMGQILSIPLVLTGIAFIIFKNLHEADRERA